MDDNKRYGIDRRVESNRRKAYDLNYFLNGGIERRVNPERRKPAERRVGWVRTEEWKSLYLGNLITAEDFKNQEDIYRAHREKIAAAAKTAKNKRHYTRFWIDDYAFAVLRPMSKKAGRIVDISLGGLSFCYPDKGEEETAAAYKLDIFLVGSKYYLDSIPFKIISERDFEIEMPDLSLTLKQCGVKFDGLTQKQLEGLDYLIMKYAGKEA